MNENRWKTSWANDQIKAMLLEQFNSFWKRDTGIPRDKLADLEKASSLSRAVFISGLRRVGKSTLLAQLAHTLGKDVFYFLNFEDDRFLGFQAEDSNEMYQNLVELFGERKIFVVDEVQNVTGWERFVRRFMDMGFKFYITGSNASLFSKELGSRLTGRYIPIELFPFSFREYLAFRRQPIPDIQRMTTADRGVLEAALSAYLQAGGIPDALKYPELPLLRTLYDDVLYRDIATRYHLDAVSVLKELAFFLISNPANLVSFNKLKDQFHLGSVNTIKNYIDHLQNSWLVFILNLYDFSVKRQQIVPKKIYCVDSGLINTVGFGFSPNTGKLLENLVFLALRKQSQKIFYYTTPGGFEVDFYIPEKKQLVQVTQSLKNPVTRERELRALADAVQSVGVSSALILSDANENDLKVNGVTVKVRSTAEWLLFPQERS
jgi:predicted AAA+ superfamily ATPase